MLLEQEYLYSDFFNGYLVTDNKARNGHISFLKMSTSQQQILQCPIFNGCDCRRQGLIKPFPQ